MSTEIGTARERESAPSAAQCLAAFAWLLCVLLGVLWTMDLVGQPPRRSPALAPPASALALPAATSAATSPAPPISPDDPASPSLAPHHLGRARAFVLMLDSLRFQTATDPKLMPYLTALRARSSHAKTLSSRDAVTVSALRAAFTGRDHFSVFGVIANFWRGDASVPSLLSQAAEAGIPIAISSDGSFNQFGARVATFSSNLAGTGPEPRRQDRAVQLALEDFVSGAHDLVIAHVTYGDHTAHKHPPTSPEYARAFRGLDALVQKVDAALSPDDTLVVMGDHGHDDEGRHSLGLDIPTLSLYRGPGFAPGVNLGLLSITEHRYLLGFALGLPLSPDYDAGRHPRALVPLGPLPQPYTGRFDPLAGKSPAAADFPSHERPAIALVSAYVGLLAALWLLHLRRRRPGRRPGPLPHLALWATVVPLAFPALRPWNAAAGLVLALAWLFLFAPLWLDPLRARRRAALLAAAAVTAALALSSWAFLLATLRTAIHEPLPRNIDLLWGASAVTGVLVTLRWGPVVATYGLFAVAALLFYPTVYNYGSMGALAPVWSCWVLFLAVPDLRAWIRLHRTGNDPVLASATLRRLAWTVALGLTLFALLQPFFQVSGNNFRFEAWVGILSPRTATRWLLFGILAKLILFVRPRAGRLSIAVALVLVALLTVIEAGLLSLVGWRGLLAMALLGATTLLLHRHRSRLASAAELHRQTTLALLLVASIHLIRVPPESRAWADGLFAALVLSCAYLRRFPDPALARGSRLFLLLTGVIVAGWVTLAWTAHRLEWAFLYDWFPGELVEQRVALFFPLILGRYALPVLIVRRLLAEGLGGVHPARSALRLGGLKFFGLAMMVLGIGCYSVASEVYIEAVEEHVIFFLLLLGLALPAGDEPEEASLRSPLPLPLPTPSLSPPTSPTPPASSPTIA